MAVHARTLPGRGPRRRRAVLYLRQSISKEDSISLELQDTSTRDHCARHNTDVVAVIKDPNRSGRTLNRRRVQEAVEYIRSGRADVIVLWKWSRLARNRRDFAVVCDLVESLGGTIESSTEPIDTSTAAGRFSRGVLAEYAAFQSEQIGETWAEVYQSRLARGLPARGGDRYGYNLKNRNDYTVHIEEGPALAEMYRMFITGSGFSRITRIFNQRGILTRSGRYWTCGVIRTMLDSGFGAGLLVVNSRLTPDKRTYLPGKHPAVITMEEWERYLALRTQRRSPAASATPKYTLTGYIWCYQGHHMHAAGGKHGPGYKYLCSRYVTTGKVDCRYISVTRTKADRAIEAWLTHIASVDFKALQARELAAERALVKVTTSTKDLRARIANVDQQMDRLITWGLQGRVPEARYDGAMKRLQDLHDSLTAELAKAEARVVRLPKRPQVPPELLESWPGLPVEAQREILQPVLERVVVHSPRPARRGGRSQVWLVVVSTWGEEFEYRD